MQKRICLFICLTALLSSCNYLENKKASDFSNSEMETKREILEDILSRYGIENAEVYVIAQLRYGENEVSKKISTESFTGSGFTPEGPPGTEDDAPPAYQDLPGKSQNYNHLDIIVNYDSDRQRTVNADYLSFLIIIDEEYKDKIPPLEESLNTFILNRQRADVLTILIR